MRARTRDSYIPASGAPAGTATPEERSAASAALGDILRVRPWAGLHGRTAALFFPTA